MASPGLCSTLTLWWKLSLSYIIITINEVRIASHPAFLEDFPAQLSLREAAHVQRPPHRPGPEVGVSHESNLWSTLQGGGEAGQLRIAGQLNGSIWYLAIKHGITWWALKNWDGRIMGWPAMWFIWSLKMGDIAPTVGLGTWWETIGWWWEHQRTGIFVASHIWLERLGGGAPVY